MKDLERFTLREYLRDPSRGVVTGKGNNVRIICVDAKNRYPIAGLIADNDGHEIVGTFCEDGRFYDGLSDERDLYFADKAVDAPKKDRPDVAAILRGCPRGTRLWSRSWGGVELDRVEDGLAYPITVRDRSGCVFSFTADGRFLDSDSAPSLFPSEDSQDWSTFKAAAGRFDPDALEPFDRVLVRNGGWDDWLPAIFGYQRPGLLGVVTAGGDRWTMCVPYNDETAGLPGTDDDCPEFYKWWED